MSAAASRAIGGLDERDDVLQQLVVEGILGGVRRHDLTAGRRPAGRHDDDHRHGLLLRQQIVEDVVRPADGGPGDRRIAAAVNQVEHGKAPGPLLVSRRRIDVHLTPRVVERFGRVADEPDSAVRHVAAFGEVAGHREQALHLRLARRHVDVARVDDGDAVHGEGVTPRTGPDRPRRRAAPDAGLAFRHRDRRRAAASSTLGSWSRGLRRSRVRIGNETAVDVAADGHGRGVRRKQPEGDAAIGFDLRRDNRRPAAAAAAPGRLSSWRLRRRGGAGWDCASATRPHETMNDIVSTTRRPCIPRSSEMLLESQRSDCSSAPRPLGTATAPPMPQCR